MQKAHIPAGDPLIISLDGGGAQETAVRTVADQFEWPFGAKKCIHHPENLGLIGNVFFCGDLTQEYESIILLEDDLVVSSVFYVYAQQSLDFYATDDQIAALSLNTPWFNGYSHTPFVPWLDESDVILCRWPGFRVRRIRRRSGVCFGSG